MAWELTRNANLLSHKLKVGEESVAHCVLHVLQVILIHATEGEPLPQLEERGKKQTFIMGLLFSSHVICYPV